MMVGPLAVAGALGVVPSGIDVLLDEWSSFIVMKNAGVAAVEDVSVHMTPPPMGYLRTLPATTPHRGVVFVSLRSPELSSVEGEWAASLRHTDHTHLCGLEFARVRDHHLPVAELIRSTIGLHNGYRTDRVAAAVADLTVNRAHDGSGADDH